MTGLEILLHIELVILLMVVEILILTLQNITTYKYLVKHKKPTHVGFLHL